MFMIRRVVGESMLPTLAPGRIVLAVRARRIVEGDIVIILHEGLEKIKRVQSVRATGVFVAGDNPPQSTDSRAFGWLSTERITAKVVLPKVRS